MKNRPAAAAIVGAAALVLLLSAPASAGTLIAQYELNESSGPVLKDATGQYPGTIGSDVRLNGRSHTFPAPSAKYRPQHLVTVKDTPALDPGTGTWSVTTRVRYTQPSGNIVQKGQAPANYFKLESHNGVVSCLFRGASGSKAVGTGRRVLNDGLWHTITCRRAGNEVSITVDGAVRRAGGATGRIDNNYPLAIGGKTSCDGGVTVGCDYWVGEMGYLRVEGG